ncbi:hypothetical protein MY3296_000116 [Beauveria thailandica]
MSVKSVKNDSQYSSSSHRILMRLAYAAATAASFTANLRKEFNEAYGDVLTMKRQLHGHIKREKALRCRAQRYFGRHQQHAAASD